MGDFFTNSAATIPGPKTNLTALPGGASVDNYVQDTDYNSVRTALLDTQGHCRGWLEANEYGIIYGGTVDEAADLSSASSAAVTQNKTLVISGSIKITTAVGTIAADILFLGNGQLDVQAGGSVTLTGRITANLHRIFFKNGGSITSTAIKVAAVYPQWWGALGDGAANDRNAIQAAIDTGKHVLLPVPPTAYNFGSSLVFNTVGQRFEGMSPRPILMQLTTGGTLAFDVQVDNVWIKNFRIVCTVTQPDLTGPGSFRGDNNSTGASGIWTGSNGLTVLNCEIDNFYCGIDATDSLNNGNFSGTRSNWRFENITVSNVTMGVLASGAVDCRIFNVRGSYRLTQNVHNPHLIYISSAVLSTNIFIDNVYARDGQNAQAVQLKGITGGFVGNIHCYNCVGALTLQDCKSLTIGPVVSVNDLGFAGVGSLYMQLGNSYCYFESINIQMASGVNERVCRFDGDYNTWGTVIAVPWRNAANTDVTYQGTNNVVQELLVRNRGTGGVGTESGTGVTVRNKRLV